MKNLISSKTYIALTKFAFVGGLSFLVDLSCYYGLTELAAWETTLSRVIAIAIATLVNYKLNKSWTWGNTQKSNYSFSAKSLKSGFSLSNVRTKYAILYTFSAWVNVMVNRTLLKQLPDNYWKVVSVKNADLNGVNVVQNQLLAIKSDKLIAVLVATILGMIINFIGQKIWVFVNSDKDQGNLHSID